MITPDWKLPSEQNGNRTAVDNSPRNPDISDAFNVVLISARASSYFVLFDSVRSVVGSLIFVIPETPSERNDTAQ